MATNLGSDDFACSISDSTKDVLKDLDWLALVLRFHDEPEWPEMVRNLCDCLPLNLQSLEDSLSVESEKWKLRVATARTTLPQHGGKSAPTWAELVFELARDRYLEILRNTSTRSWCNHLRMGEWSQLDPEDVTENWTDVSSALNEIPAVDVGHLRAAVVHESTGANVTNSPNDPKSSEPTPAASLTDKDRYPSPENFERDQWIYEQKASGRTRSQILKDLEGKLGWVIFTSPTSIQDCVVRYATHMDLPIVRGHSGRPRDLKN